MKERFYVECLGATDAENKQQARFTGDWHSKKRIAYLGNFKIRGGRLTSEDLRFLMVSTARRL